LCTVSGRWRDPVGQGHQVAIGGTGRVEFVGPFFEFLAQVEELLFELSGARS
jgi:hypothetical protein